MPSLMLCTIKASLYLELLCVRLSFLPWPVGGRREYTLQNRER
jgi:hypothetical protein